MLLLIALAYAAPQSAAAPTLATPPITTIAPASAATDRVTAALAHFREVTSAMPGRCVGRAGEIVVCGGGRSAMRLPLPPERVPGDVFHDATGRAALAAESGRPCPLTGCTGVNLLAVPVKMFRIARALIDRDR